MLLPGKTINVTEIFIYYVNKKLNYCILNIGFMYWSIIYSIKTLKTKSEKVLSEFLNFRRILMQNIFHFSWVC